MHKVEIILIFKQQQKFVKYDICFTKIKINYISIGCSVVCFFASMQLCYCIPEVQYSSCGSNYNSSNTAGQQ